ncbi:MAG TPA: RecX family transcriptional regulator [Roseiflexaceae bacterium]|nr:RecX family transcriptional regulator [Roseiflexaceae bacterium]
MNVFVDGEFAFGVSLNTISKQGLYVGRTLSEEEFARVELAEGSDKALQAAYRLLEVRPRSVAEIRDRLRRKEFSPEQIEATIERLTALDMLDDAAFARLWVENRQTLRPRGVSALRDELRRKGIDRAVADTILSDEALTSEEGNRAMEIARNALKKYATSPDRATFQRRLGGFLQRRGFGFDTIGPIVDTLWAELEAQRASDAD